MLEHILNRFQKKYHSIAVDPTILDVTDCFQNGKVYDGPASFGGLPNNRVIAYVVKGAPLLCKYEKDTEGKLLTVDGHSHIRTFDDDITALSCLCASDMKNTSLHE